LSLSRDELKVALRVLLHPDKSNKAKSAVNSAIASATCFTKAGLPQR
jgi:hypothetical protein